MAVSLWLVRHGETAWSRDRLHTSVTDVPLTPAGVEAAQALGARLVGRVFALVLDEPALKSPSERRARRLPGCPVDEDLAEWDYGRYEGVSTAQIRRDGPRVDGLVAVRPGRGDRRSVGDRVDRVIARCSAVDGDVLLFGHAHCLRALTARWLGQPVVDGRLYRLDTASLSVSPTSARRR